MTHMNRTNRTASTTMFVQDTVLLNAIRPLHSRIRAPKCANLPANPAVSTVLALRVRFRLVRRWESLLLALVPKHGVSPPDSTTHRIARESCSFQWLELKQCGTVRLVSKLSDPSSFLPQSTQSIVGNAPRTAECGLKIQRD